jgi:hypothetical protein
MVSRGDSEGPFALICSERHVRTVIERFRKVGVRYATDRIFSRRKKGMRKDRFGDERDRQTPVRCQVHQPLAATVW